jgi:hypothetical protein
MILDTSAFVVIASDRTLPAEPLQAFMAALATLLRDTVVETSDIGRQVAAPWLAPSGVTIHFRTTPLIVAVLQELRSCGTLVTAALVSLYQALDAGPSDAKTMPLNLRFQPRASESFCFVFGHGLAPASVEQALSRVPLVLREAETRLEQNERAIEGMVGDTSASRDDGRAELVHLYAGPVLGWEVLA